jgi:hypothetical protein
VVRQFRRARLRDEYAYLFLDGASLRMRRLAGRKRVRMPVVYERRTKWKSVDRSRALALARRVPNNLRHITGGVIAATAPASFP